MYVLYRNISIYCQIQLGYFQTLGLPAETWEIARMKHTGLFSYFTRFDFIVNGEDIRLMK